MLIRYKKDRIKRALKEAIKNYKYHKFGKCNICGKNTIFICIDLSAARNNMYCIFCRSSSRKRHVAKIIIDEVVKDVSSISDIPRSNKKICILNTSIDDSFYKVLYSYKYFFSSDFLPDIPPGTELRERVFCQDLQNLTFDDESFDIIITEDVLEHVKDHMKSFKEISRVLKAGGYHIFTVPFVFDRPTIVRVDTEKDVSLLPPEYHDDYIRGKILAYRTFGTDLFSLLDKLGFDTFIHISKYKDQRWGIFDSYVFVSKKKYNSIV